MSTTTSAAVATATRIRDAVSALTTELVRAEITPMSITVFAHQGSAPLLLQLAVSTQQDMNACRRLFGMIPASVRFTFTSADGTLLDSFDTRLPGHGDLIVRGPQPRPFRLVRRGKAWHVTEGRDTGSFYGPDVSLFRSWDAAVAYLVRRGYDTTTVESAQSSSAVS